MYLQQNIFGLDIGVNNLMMREQIQRLSDLYDQRSQKISAFSQLIVQRLVFDHVKLVIFIYFVFSILLVDVVEHVAQGAVAALIYDKGARVHDGVGEHPQQVENAGAA